MGTRTLEARLTARLLALMGAVLAAVGLAAVVVSRHVLDASDTDAARARAESACEALAHERSEGDTIEQALEEVVGSGQGQGVRFQVRMDGVVSGATALPRLAPGTCASMVDERREPWRACAAGDKVFVVVAAIPVGSHVTALNALAREMLAVLGVALIATWFAIRRALRSPITELAALVRWTAEIAEAEPATAPPTSKTEEIARLEAAFDALVRRLLQALARERANSAHMAHELRTPLTSIMTELEAVRAAHEGARPAVDRVLGDISRFADVIEAILALSGPYDARGEAILNIADVARELAPPGIELEAPDEALVEGDERLVRLALRNLLENARKYAQGARVVRLTREGKNVRVTVIDQGPGLSDAARERMFERYWRSSADGDGRGLGLALVRAVAERHGGRAEARAGTGGVGLEVSMTFAKLTVWHEQPPA
jgi:signal transduction histidine kinase